ncbi:aldehyde dehydrogenase [Nocardia carnea]|uniref:aldehyde dehydrogenase n=1 Tax=Nocardia carnea TaxID=37328 RepID=UPI002456F7DB|nr:aldehyde dehydrogenase [Nocardia carnea]
MEITDKQLYFGGAWHLPGGGRSVQVVSPIDERTIGTVTFAAPADVDAAVTAARGALRSPDWAGISPGERWTLLEGFADELEKSAEQRAVLTTIQNGMPIGVSNWAEGQGVVDLLRYYIALGRETPIEERRPRVDGMGTTVVRREPIGVVAAIIPWNAPQFLTMTKLAPALVAGCSIVIKPSPETSLDAFELAATADRAGLPAGVINIVTGDAEVGEYLISHPGVDKVAFTGSTAAGRTISAICGKLMRPVSLELGGKSAAIVLDDADAAQTVTGLATSSLLSNGQICFLSTRILAPRDRHDEILEAVASLAAGLAIGDPFDPATGVGPVVSARQRDRIESYIQLGKESGATLATGGSRPDLEKGWFVTPTVFGNVSNESRVAREEIFGPVLTVIPYGDVDDAVAIANDSEYGLGGTIWTSDTDKGLEIARRVESGTVGVNFYNLDYGAPFGGVKASGLGRELGPEGLATYHQLKSIFLAA